MRTISEYSSDLRQLLEEMEQGIDSDYKQREPMIREELDKLLKIE